MAVAVDDAGDWTVRSLMLLINLQSSFGAFTGNERVDDDDTFFAFNNCHVGEVKGSNLINSGRDLIQTLLRVELPLSPKEGVCRIRTLPLEKLEVVNIPHNIAFIVLDDARLEGGNETLISVDEVPPVVKGRFCCHCSEMLHQHKRCVRWNRDIVP